MIDGEWPAPAPATCRSPRPRGRAARRRPSSLRGPTTRSSRCRSGRRSGARARPRRAPPRRRARSPHATGPSTSACLWWRRSRRAPRLRWRAATVSSGHFTWTKCTSAGSSMPASPSPRAPRRRPCRPARDGRDASAGSAAVWARPNASAGPSAAVTFGTLEHGPVRRHAALGAAGHHQADFRRVVRGKMPLEHQAERERRIAAREVVDQAVALGLAEHRDHALADRYGPRQWPLRYR